MNDLQMQLLNAAAIGFAGGLGLVVGLMVGFVLGDLDDFDGDDDDDDDDED